MLKITKGRCVGILLAALAGLSGCRQPDAVPVETSDEPVVAVRVDSAVYVADPASADQLKSGFHAVEQNAWRWTEREFSVVLGPPQGAAEFGALLEFRLAIPDAVISMLSPLTLSAVVGGVSLAPETYSRAGEFIYSREIPPSALAGDAVTIDFSLDKAIQPGKVDRRELGVIASSFVLRLP